MTKRLNGEQIQKYLEQGFLSPLDGIKPEEAAELRYSMEQFERETGLSLRNDLHFKTHLYFSRLVDLTLTPSILDAVEDVIGPNILVFASNFWVKGARDRTFVSWHQDSAYFGLDPHEEVTAWIALTDSNRSNGCMRVIPGSHREPARQHVETFDEKNLLARGQSIDAIEEKRAADLELTAGQFSLHNERTIHGSLENDSDDARIGYALFFIPTHVRSTIGRRGAWLVRGEDHFGHWDPDPTPDGDRDPMILKYMQECYDRYVSASINQEATGIHV